MSAVELGSLSSALVVVLVIASVVAGLSTLFGP
jgi:hypothetical protein